MQASFVVHRCEICYPNDATDRYGGRGAFSRRQHRRRYYDISNSRVGRDWRVGLAAPSQMSPIEQARALGGRHCENGK